MVADYIRHAGGPPDPDMPWHYFVLVCRHIGRYTAQDTLAAFQAVRLGAWGKDADLRVALEALTDQGYGEPVHRITIDG